MLLSAPKSIMHYGFFFQQVTKLYILLFQMLKMLIELKELITAFKKNLKHL